MKRLRGYCECIIHSNEWRFMSLSDTKVYMYWPFISGTFQTIIEFQEYGSIFRG